RAPGAASAVVPRNEQRSRLGNARPRCDLHNGADRAGAGARAHLAQPFAQARAVLGAGGEQLELAAGGLGELDELDAKLEHGRGQLGEPRRERNPDAAAVGARLAQGERPPPRAAADEARAERDLADETGAALRPR